MSEIVKCFDTNDDINAIRHEVFMQEQGISYTDEFEGDEDSFIHFCCYRNGLLIGYIRVSISNDEIHIGRLAVRKRFRKQGIGTKLMATAEKFGRENTCKIASLNAQIQAKGFYAKLGYIECGDTFLEANIEHILMKKHLVRKRGFCPSSKQWNVCLSQ